MPTDRRVAVIGLGYVGLPLALSLVEAGLDVVGIDTSRARVAGLGTGNSPIDDVPDDRLANALALGMRVVGPEAARIAEADAIVVCVPTPVTADREPDLQPVLAAAATIARGLRRGHLVILQSTSFPGTTTGPFRAGLEASGLRAGVDFDLAFAPERVNPGDPGSAGRTMPRLVGGTTPWATGRAVALLRKVNDTIIEMSSPDAAELAKLAENTFRNLNIAFVNQLALLCERMGLDVWEVLDGAATKPFGFMRFSPGPGVGGHCIPVDPFYLAARAREFGLDDRLVAAAAEVNEGMPGHVVGLVERALEARGWAIDGARVGILGVAFKPNIRDARNSPAAGIMTGLAGRGAEIRFHDPHVWSFRDAAGEEHLANDLNELLHWSDVVVVVTAHAAIDWDTVYREAELVVDTVDSSRGRRVRADQVLRLGAGWGAGS
jgi:UDP-N-acetyl-D-glucosamine dehydrogenase